MSDKTIFSKIIDREVPSTILYEDNDFIVIKDINPRAPIHFLVITKQPYPSLEAVEPDNDLIYAGLLKIARRVAAEQGIADNYKLIMNVGKKLQLVHHIHLHVLGGWSDAKLEVEKNNL